MAESRNKLILSIFPGIDLLGRAFEEIMPDACLVRGPDVLWGGDIRAFHPPKGIWGGIVGGPPCQCFSRLAHLVKANGYELAENLIPEFERVVAEARPDWFLMENVPAAPEPVVPGYTVRDYLLNNRWVGGSQNRLRRFSFGSRAGLRLDIEIVALEDPERTPAVTASATVWVPVKLGGSGKVKSTYQERKGGRPEGHTNRQYLAGAIRAQGLPPDFLEDAPFTVAGKIRVVGNGVPLPMGRAIARAVKRALEAEATC